MIVALILLSSRKATRVLVLRSIQSNVVTMDNLRKAFVRVLPADSWISRVWSENRIRPADNSVRSLHHHVQTPQCRSARWPIKSVLPSRTSQHHTEGHAKVCWVIHTVVTRSWAVSGRVNHNLQLTTICALLATRCCCCDVILISV